MITQYRNGNASRTGRLNDRLTCLSLNLFPINNDVYLCHGPYFPINNDANKRS